jgi:hypothetical protein
VKAAVRSLADLGEDVILAPERHLALVGAARGVPLGDLVEERRERAQDPDVVLDTTHARDGILDIAGGLRDAAPAKSAKKRARAGDLLVSRLRPYLRQIAYVHPAAIGKRTLAVSTEFYVLRARAGDGAWLLPFLLSAPAQRALAAAQEGGHHPRVPRSLLLALPIPDDIVRARAKTSRDVLAALASLYRARAAYRALLDVE